MSDTKPRRKLAAILAADVVSFSMMMGDNEDRTLKNLKACRALTDEFITSNHGRIFGSAGDSIIAEFASPVDAVVAATEFQRSLRQRNEGVAPEDQMVFRVGLNLGDVIVEGDNLYGDGVNVAARLEAMAEPGGISLSGKFHEEVCRKLDMSFVSTGDQEMKNIRTPVSTYKVEISKLPEMEPSSGSAAGIPRPHACLPVDGNTVPPRPRPQMVGRFIPPVTPRVRRMLSDLDQLPDTEGIMIKYFNRNRLSGIVNHYAQVLPRR